LALPLSIRVPHQTDDGVAICDVLDTGKDLLDVLPEDDILPINLAANDVFEVWLSLSN
jgi:hypothetical protein